MKSDWLALAISYVYVFAAIFAGEGLRRWRNYSTDFTRKFIHIAVGMWSIGTVLLFEHWYFAIIPPISFVIINYISYRRETFKAMETGERGNLGTVYFPISFALVIVLFWMTRPDRYPGLIVAALMPMTWGDAMAAILGHRFGQYKYHFWGTTRSMEGSLTMFLFSWLTTFLALLCFPPLGLLSSLLQAFLVALVTSLVEASSPWHIDNITVPLSSALILYLLSR
ncbi:MAG: phosphatidate cytidylyltransferase [Anaerolineae bacterium]|jgi:dolichol kinase|nr:phosphatidate cytidylyltransferase [Anaerolineae bacterium]MDH7475107.1 phosphatidate cytidylyltransferase [Anaerolineae bacterium]